mmetsp:Transcript_14055/g.23958  ORF Transcript_14055/g.23958 Transcript_14055/m.23958 type:complete len:235 (-) Transcript_14055:857-1561(-)
MASSKRPDAGIILDETRQDGETVNGGIKGIRTNTRADITIHIEDRSSNPKGEMKDIIENASESCAIQSMMSSNEYGKANRNKMVGSKAPWGHLSLTPQRSSNGANTENGESRTPSLHLSRDISTLARLYHSSRRSRHSPQNKEGAFCGFSPEMLPLPPFTFLSSLEGQNICQEINNIDKAHEDQWDPSIIASPIRRSWSSISISSVGSEEFIGSEWLREEESIERDAKRRKTTP